MVVSSFNKRGVSITIFYWLVMAIVVVILGIALMTPTKQPIDESRTALSCSAPANDFDQATCWTLDIMKFLFPTAVIGIGFYLLWRQQ